MRLTLSVLFLGIALTALMPQTSIHAQDQKTIRVRQAYPYSPPSTIVFVDNFGIVDGGGDALESIDATSSVSSRWINKSDRVVVLMFDNQHILGRESVRINPGETYVKLWRARSWPVKPSMTIVCKRDAEFGEAEDHVMRIRVLGPPPKVSTGGTGGG